MGDERKREVGFLGERFEKALIYAFNTHLLHLRKGTDTPYYSHLLATCALVLENEGDEDGAIAALLHDVVEDHGGQPRLNDVRRRFGDRVGKIVEGLSDSLEEDPANKRPWRPRKEEYLEHLAAESDRSVLLVSAADKAHNVRTILADLDRVGEEVWRRFEPGRENPAQGRKEVGWYYRELLAIYVGKVPDALLNDLRRTVDTIWPPTGEEGVPC